MPYVFPAGGMFKISLFSVHRSVGLGPEAMNLPDDVRLVQWLLTQASYKFAGAPLQIDGMFGPVTDYHLIRFWLSVRSRDPIDANQFAVEYHMIAKPLFNGALMSELNEPIKLELKKDWRFLLTRMPMPLRKALEADIRPHNLDHPESK
jgi:hypothetical protein